LRQPLGVAIVGGLLLSQLLTLTHEHYNLELRSTGQVVRNDQGAEASRGPPRGLPERLRQPRDFDGDPSRLVLRQHLRPPRFGFAPRE
jgi:hypothetical protein